MKCPAFEGLNRLIRCSMKDTMILHFVVDNAVNNSDSIKVGAPLDSTSGTRATARK